MWQLLIMPAVDATVTAVCMMLVIHCTSGQTCMLHYGFIVAMV